MIVGILARRSSGQTAVDPILVVRHWAWERLLVPDPAVLSHAAYTMNSPTRRLSCSIGSCRQRLAPSRYLQAFRKCEADRGSSIWQICGADFTAVLLDDRSRDRQAHA